MNYAIRVTRSYQELKPFFEYLQSACNQVVVYQHDTDRCHVHALLMGCTVSTDTLKYNIKKVLNVTAFPKSDWSFKTEYNNNPVDHNFIIYMSKGDLEPKFVYNVDDEFIRDLKGKWEKPKIYSGFKQFKLISEKPATQKQRLNQLLEPVCTAYNKKQIRSSREVINMICEIIRKEKLVVGRYKIRDYYDYVMNQVNESDWNEQIFSLCIKA